MDNGFNNESVPSDFAYCFNHQCTKNKKCMRYLVAEFYSSAKSTIRIINPAGIPEDTNSCMQFHPIRKMRVAWGITHLFDNLPYKDVTGVRAQLINHFGRNNYYRIYRKELGLTPEEQKVFRQVFQKKGITDEPAFEYYTEEYQWICDPDKNGYVENRSIQTR